MQPLLLISGISRSNRQWYTLAHAMAIAAVAARTDSGLPPSRIHEPIDLCSPDVRFPQLSCHMCLAQLQPAEPAAGRAVPAAVQRQRDRRLCQRQCHRALPAVCLHEHWRRVLRIPVPRPCKSWAQVLSAEACHPGYSQSVLSHNNTDLLDVRRTALCSQMRSPTRRSTVIWRSARTPPRCLSRCALNFTLCMLHHETSSLVLATALCIGLSLVAMHAGCADAFAPHTVRLIGTLTMCQVRSD